MTSYKNHKISVVIPCYKVADQIEAVVKDLPTWIWRVYVIDDNCPQKSGKFVEKKISMMIASKLYTIRSMGV